MILRVMVWEAFSNEPVWFVSSHQREPADQEFGRYCQERRLCAWFWVPHYYAGGGTKVSDMFQIFPILSMNSNVMFCNFYKSKNWNFE